MGMRPQPTAFPRRWAPEHPDRIQLFSLATPNGQKLGIALEEMELPYEAHLINILDGDQFDPEYVAINPNSKIPSIIDPDGPDGEPIAMMESGAILLYLAQKSGKLWATNPRHQWEITQWVIFQVAHIGPFFGQFGHFFKFARGKTTDEYALERYTKESRRLLGVLDARLEGRDYLVADRFTIADVATFPWVKTLGWYGGGDVLELDSYKNVQPWLERCLARPAVKRGIAVTPFPGA